jgi:predicted negative regulator of RcsB-dependent stress response
LDLIIKHIDNNLLFTKYIVIDKQHALEHNDLSSLFITLSECYCNVEKIDKAIQTVNDAYKYLKDTKYEGEIKLAEAKIAMCKNDLKSALKILNAIKSDQDIFIKVHLFLFYILFTY